MNEDVKSQNTYLSFVLAGEIFAVNVHKVLEVVEMQKITQLPQTPDYILGMINFRGEVLPVVDTRQKFNMSRSTNLEKNVIIVLDLNIKDEPLMLGTVVDAVKDVLEITPDKIKNVPVMGAKYSSELVRGMVKTPEGFIIILDIDRVFSTDLLTLIQETIDEESILLDNNNTQIEE